MVKAIICDFDGVNRKILPSGTMVYLKGIQRLGFWRTLEMFRVALYLLFQEILAYFGLLLGSPKPLWHQGNQRDLIPGSIETLKYLKGEGYKLGMVTNRKRKILGWHAGRLGLDLGLFDLIITRDSPFKKPDPRVFREFFCLWKLFPQEILYVGDRYELDYLTTQEAGLKIIMVCSSFTTHSDFLKLGVSGEEILRSLVDLPAYLKRRDGLAQSI